MMCWVLVSPIATGRGYHWMLYEDPPALAEDPSALNGHLWSELNGRRFMSL